MSLARRLGLDVPAVSKGVAGKSDYFLVERYDRIKHGDGRIERIHQEDFCQALNVSPELKYEEEGGPGISHCQELIQRTTGRPAAEMLRFQQMLIFHYLIGNADAHAKNYAPLHRGKVPDLAQYDRLSFSTDRVARRRALLRFFAWASNLPHLRDLSCPNYSR